MIEIDGSIGEGGGQILRTSISLATILNKPIKIYNIRAKRPKPGLKAQHAAGIRAAAKICDAKIKGVELNSTEIIFEPNKIKGGKYNIDIGTAGSITLILQILLPILAFAPEKTELHIRGGTDVNWSPPINYLQFVIVPILRKMGYNFNIKLLKRGHYPKGGGKIYTEIFPVINIEKFAPPHYKKIISIEGISHCVRLPKHVAIRQKESALKALKRSGFENINIKTETYNERNDPHLGPGSGIVLWAIPDNNIPIGADSYGERGKKAEIVGEEAANKLIKELKTKAILDIHAGDFIIPYIALAKGESRILIRELTKHI